MVVWYTMKICLEACFIDTVIGYRQESEEKIDTFSYTMKQKVTNS